MKAKIWARIARAVFNGFAVGTMAFFSVYGLTSAVNTLAGTTVLSAMGSGLLTFFSFFGGSIGIELSKDIEETQKETA
ncbi:hypothetical protein J7L49_06835 [Candidatus Bathyarchaeota archaeon]|nr:hypothetical protein [Candidatus Bathyarchaeota archaeon]RJS79668.1 MAG: hypothetical protein CW708_01830 [Candidatus Bathyarchaeota archaeon]